VPTARKTVHAAGVQDFYYVQDCVGCFNITSREKEKRSGEKKEMERKGEEGKRIKEKGKKKKIRNILIFY
jgi:stage III sporulation protein SpoIIIAA